MNKRTLSTLVVALAMGFYSLTSTATTYYVDASRPDDSENGLSWNTAKKSIQAAVDLVVSNDTIVVTNGIYSSISISNKVVLIQSVNGATATIIDGGNTNRCATLGSSSSHTNTVLLGFSLRNGYSNFGGGSYCGTLNNCVLTANMVTSDGGGSCYGILNNCVLASNKANRSGGGSWYSTINRCTLTGNTASVSGGGSYYGTLNNCTLTSNKSDGYGGGSYNGTLINCTLTGNKADYDGGGANGSTLKNCILWGNIVSSGTSSNFYFGNFTYSCTTPLPSGQGNMSVDPLIVDAVNGDCRLRAGSPCINRGTNTFVVGAWDISGNPRIIDTIVDMGAHEGDEVPGFVISARVQGTGILSNMTAVVSSGGSATFYAIETIRAFSHFLTNGVLASTSTIFTWDNIQSDGIITAVFNPTLFVDSARLDDSGDGMRWATAKKTIQAAVDLAAAGETVLVTNGVYNTGTRNTPGYVLNNRLVITNAITVRSVNGPDVTVIEGSGTNFFSTSSAVRCVYMNKGVLEGFTLNKGTTFAQGIGSSDDYERRGGGVNMYMYNPVAEPLLTNCVISGCNSVSGGGAYYGKLNNCNISGNSAADDGGGAYLVTLNNCTILGNSAADNGGGVYNYGGGSYSVTINNCTISGNSAADDGGGAYSSTLNNCTISGNSAADDGGGVRLSTLNNCTISGNSANGGYGGGSNLGTLNNCKITENVAHTDGGGSFDSTLNNCTITGNIASGKGGGSYSGILKNCTISRNTSSSAGGGVNGVTLNNCIVWGNIKADGTDNNFTNSVFNYSCTTPLPSSGIGNIDANPQLVDTINLRLRLGSPCIDTGDNVYATLPADLAGNPRIQNGTVDMGAYEGGVAAVSRPSFAPLSGASLTNTATINISCDTDGTTIYYTLDGSEPNESSTLYTAPIQVFETLSTNGSICLRTRAYKTGMVSAQETATYTLYAATPVFDPPTGTTGTNSLMFSISCLSSNAEIRYTTNGTSPTIASPIYTLPVTLTQSATIKAKAFKSGMADSSIATAAYTVIQTVATPTVSPASGSVSTNSLVFTLACATAGASIRYTTDGSEPTSTSTLYSSSRTLTQTSTVKAKAFKSGMADSATATATYTVIQTVATPTLSPISGTVATNSLVFTLSCATADASIRYTTDGSDPTSTSTLYSVPQTLTQSATIKAKAFKSGMADSSIATAAYTVIQTVATPTISPVSGTVATNSLIFTLTCITSGASIRYTTDGSEPTSASTLYSAPQTLAQTATVKARAFKSGMAESAPAEATYTILQTVATPTISPADGTTFSQLRKVTMSCSTSGAEIRYTTDGSIPTLMNTLYAGSFNISQTTTFKVKAFKDGWVESAYATSTYYRLPSLNEALDSTNLTVTTSGNAIWFSQTNMTHDGVDAAQSGILADSQSTWMETQISGPGTVSFWWRTSCEDDPDSDNWDYVRFLVDGVEQSRLDGITGWQRITHTVTSGTHILHWEYIKDDSIAAGEDCAWVDQLVFSSGSPITTTTTPVPVPYSWLDLYPSIMQMAGGNYEVAAYMDFDLDGCLTWEEYVAGTSPTNGLSGFQALIGASDGLPAISWLPDLRPDRIYTVLGKTNLTDAAWGPTNAASRFFKVTVDMP